MPFPQVRSSSVRPDTEGSARVATASPEGPRRSSSPGTPRAAGERALSDDALEPHWLSAIDAATD